MCLLASKIHHNFHLRNKLPNCFCNPLGFYLLTQVKFALPYTTAHLAHNLLGD